MSVDILATGPSRHRESRPSGPRQRIPVDSLDQFRPRLIKHRHLTCVVGRRPAAETSFLQSPRARSFPAERRANTNMRWVLDRVSGGMMENPSPPSCTRSLGIIPSMISLSKRVGPTIPRYVAGRRTSCEPATRCHQVRTKYTPLTSRSSIATTLPEVLSTSIFPSEIKAADRNRDHVAVHLSDYDLLVCRRQGVNLMLTAELLFDCRTFEGKSAVSKSSF